MSPDHKNIKLLIDHKEQELKTLKEEWRKASWHPQDTDYEYLALLYPIIAELEHEIARFRELAGNEYSGELYFPEYIRQILNGECHRLEMHIEFGERTYQDFKGPLMIFEKPKQKYAITARLPQYDWFEGYLPGGTFEQFYSLGWKWEGKKYLRLKHIIRNERDLRQFHSLVARTFMEPLAYVMQRAPKQHFVVIPLPDNE